VISAGKLNANRANARASTGPKTAHGRAHSVRNARRHGLSLPVLVDPGLSGEVEALACEIAGADANPVIHELARRIAEAQVDLRRVRSARRDLLSSALSDRDDERATACSEAAKSATIIHMSDLVHDCDAQAYLCAAEPFRESDVVPP
jgi:hypothetical protein